MLEAYHNGKDLYAIIASMIFDVPYETCLKEKENEEYRDYCKSLLLGILYGMGIPTVAEMMGKTPKEAQKILDEFFAKFPKVKGTIDRLQISCKKNGFVKTVYGRKRRLPDINLPEYEVKCDDPKKRKEYRNALKKARYWKQKQRIKEQAKAEDVEIKDNTGFIAEAERQTTNSAVQGCLHKDTMICTKEHGYKKIGKLPIDEKFNIWDGEKYTKGHVKPSGKKREVIIKFNNGQEIRCSEDHKFLTVNTNGNEIFKTPDEFCKVERIKLGKEVDNFHAEIDSLDYEYETKAPNGKDISLLDKFDDLNVLGRILGRVYSDGYIRKDKSVSFIVAEHEIEVLDYLEKHLPFKYRKDFRDRENRNQIVYRLMIDSTSLAKQIELMYPDYLFSDKELLRGFISGYFDGDGTVTGKTVSVTYGRGEEKYEKAKLMQKALSVFGIQTRLHYYSYRTNLVIRRRDVKKFANKIGFINPKKQKKVEDMVVNEKISKIYGRAETVDEVIYTDNYVEMYDVMDTGSGRFVADGFITHNSASDMTKKAIVLIDNDEQLKELGYELLLPVHDEVIGQVPNDKETIEKAKKRVGELMIKAGDPVEVKMSVDNRVSEKWYGEEIK